MVLPSIMNKTYNVKALEWYVKQFIKGKHTVRFQLTKNESISNHRLQLYYMFLDCRMNNVRCWIHLWAINPIPYMGQLRNSIPILRNSKTMNAPLWIYLWWFYDNIQKVSFWSFELICSNKWNFLLFVFTFESLN